MNTFIVFPVNCLSINMLFHKQKWKFYLFDFCSFLILGILSTACEQLISTPVV